MNFVHQIDSTVVLAEFVFCINEDQTAFSSDFSSTFEESQCIFLQSLIFFGSSESLFQDFFLRDIFVVQSHFRFRCRGDDRFREFLVFAHTIRQFHTADFAYAAFVSTPCATAQIAAYNHFYRKAFAQNSDSNHRVRRSHFPVRTDVSSGIEEFGCNLIQHLAFVRDTFR